MGKATILISSFLVFARRGNLRGCVWKDSIPKYLLGYLTSKFLSYKAVTSQIYCPSNTPACVVAKPYLLKHFDSRFHIMFTTDLSIYAIVGGTILWSNTGRDAGCMRRSS